MTIEEKCNDLTPRQLFILASTLWRLCLFVEFKEPYKTLALYAKFPDGTILDDSQDLVEAALSNDKADPSLVQYVLARIDECMLPEALKRFISIPE